MSDLCNTRRSAGVPYLFSAIACADSATSKSKLLLKQIIATLFPIAAQNESPDISCHARNILRMIFRESAIGEDTLLWAEEALIFCISGFGDKSWALRNTSAMLYATLCSRIFGVKKSAGLEDEEKISSSEFFNRFPILEAFLLQIVELGAQDQIDKKGLNTMLLPALLIIQRLIPTGASNNEARFQASLLQLVQSKVWKCRMVAARCIYALNNRPPKFIIAEVMTRLASDSSSNQNSIHGLLLVLEKFRNSDEIREEKNLKTLIELLPKSTFASVAVAIKILTKSPQPELKLYMRKMISSTTENQAEYEVFAAWAEYCLENELIEEILFALRQLENRPNAARAMIISIDDRDRP